MKKISLALVFVSAAVVAAFTLPFATGQEGADEAAAALEKAVDQGKALFSDKALSTKEKSSGTLPAQSVSTFRAGMR